MEYTLYNGSFERVMELDSFYSMIWNDRYNEYGDFEISVPAQSEFKALMEDGYIKNTDSDHVMILEDVSTTTNESDGDSMIVKGRSLESILDRRIVWTQTVISGNLQKAIKRLLNEAIISPEVTERKIDNFIFEESTDPNVTAAKISEKQFTGDNLYEVIQKLTSDAGLGFIIYLNDDNQFVFKLYCGTDRSYDQTDNPYVTFSPEFDNLISSEYMKISSAYKNVAEVGGEGEGSERKMTTVGTATGLDRRETFVDARDLSQTVDDEQIPDADYLAQLQERGSENLSELAMSESFESEVDATQMYIYGRDFWNGDIVQIKDNLGTERRVRINEIVFSESDRGSTTLPTFKII